MQKFFIKLLPFSLCIAYSFNVIAQNNYADSLIKVISAQKEDTNKVDALASLNYYYSTSSDYDKTMQTAKEILALSTKINYREGLAYGNLAMALAYSIKQDRFLEMEYYNKALVLYKATGDKPFIMSGYDNMANAFVMEGNYGKALENRYASQELREHIGDKQLIAEGFYNIAAAYSFSKKNPEEISKNALAALSLYKALNDKKDMGSCYSMIGLAYIDQKKYTEALGQLNKALEISKEAGVPDEIGFTYLEIGGAYEKLGDSAYSYQSKAAAVLNYHKAKENSLAALKAFRTSPYYLTQSAACFDILGQTSMKLGNFITAKKYLDSSLAIYQSARLLPAISLVYYNLSELDRSETNYKGAYRNYQLYHLYNDSLHGEENAKKAAQVQMQYDFDKKEDATRALQNKKDVLAKAEINKQKLIRNSTLGGVGLIALFSFLLVRSFSRRRKTAFDKQVSEVEMKALRSQMNPHFIFNSLHSINKYMADNDKEHAAEYLSKFAKLMRLILENSREQEVPLQDDLSALELYMQLESLRFQNRFQYYIHVDSQIDTENTLIPPMLLQPFVENSIIHGLSKRENGMIRIKIEKENNMIRCTVEDNGIGREQSVTIAQGDGKKHGSLGMKITRERLQIINQLKKVKAAVNIFDLKDDSNRPAGLRVELLLPFETAF